ncbi:MAG TPA: acetylxylan esterase [Bryobacteraceae bacterium]|nr:acetylxylan esterase [Bryobacteraceae bacterium]
MKPLALTFLLLPAAALAQPPNLDFLTNQVDGRTLRDMLPDYYRAQVKQHRRTSPATTAEFRKRFIEGMGGLPERTPLNARVVGSLARDGYRIEKVIFESQPGFHVTANLYLPATGKGPFPAILFPLGHESGGKAYPVWQQLLATFARRGYVAFAWDPAGQGERVQHWDEALGDSKVAPSTTEHTILGIQALVVGDAFAKYTIWDGIRALDYLLSRPEVDAKRVGITGNSGGGTHTAYIAALEDRLHVAAPSCFITSWQRLLETIGPQDAEQCIPGFLGHGFEHVDFIRAFAPKPYIVLSAIRDFFSLQGARSTYATATETYLAAAARDRISMAETDEGHGYTINNRLASYKWFDRWLKDADAPEGETPVPPALEAELACTKTGQVATSLGGETVYTLTRARARAIQTPAKPSLDDVRRFAQLRHETAVPPVRRYGVVRHGDLQIEKLIYETEPGIQIPAVTVTKLAASSAARPGVLLVSARGKAARWAEIEVLASAGATVLAIDARGLGETRPTEATKGGSWLNWFGDYDSAMTSVMLGTSLVSQRAADIQAGYRLLASMPGIDPKQIYGAGQGNAAPAVLHAAALVDFKSLLLDDMVASYRSIAEAPIHKGVFESIVPGAIRHYDLPGLAASIAVPVILVDPVSPMGQALTPAAAQDAYKSVPNVRIVSRAVEEPMARVYPQLLK